MTLTIHIPPDTGTRLQREAARLGVDEEEYVKRLIEKDLPNTPPGIDQATLDLLSEWDKEDETNDPAEITRRIQEFEALKSALNQNRLDAGGSQVRKVFP